MFAEVRVDADLGRIRVVHVVGAYGAGRILNAKMARSQMIGGIVYGLAMALTEHTVIDTRTGRYVNADLAEYHVPVNADIGEIQVSAIDVPDFKLNSIGARGIGEIGITGTGAAVANAIFHATGKRINRLPIHFDELL